MTTYYKIIRSVTPEDLNTSPGIIEILKMIPSSGYVTFEHFKSASNIEPSCSGVAFCVMLCMMWYISYFL